jgi:RsiW-degrading membrane proteinase PrsW (M82 family)
MNIEPPIYCAICGRPLKQPREYGQRYYCQDHLAAFVQDIPPVWQASAWMFGFLLLTILGIGIAGQFLSREPQGTIRFIISAGLSVLPALGWLFFVYRSAARTRTEIPNLVLIVFTLAALVAAAIVRPFLYSLINLDDWLTSTTPSNRFLGSILIGGAVHAFVLYSLVRYTVWQTPAFTRRVDGVLYGLAAAWGYASALDFLFVLDQGGVTLLNGSLRLITQTGAYLSTSLIIGYFLGRNRFENLPFFYLGLGFMLAATVNGLLLYAGSELNNIQLSFDQSGFSPWPGLVVVTLVLALSFGAIYGLFKRHNALTKARIEQMLNE